MEKNDIKKSLYKQNPNAHIQFVRKGIVYYYADLEEMRVHFQVPVEDMGDADFLPTMEGKLLIRWIV
jgi:hypothetical protein